MKILINGVIYDSTKTPIVIEFDSNEKELFNGMKKFVSAPLDYTEDQREELLNKSLEELNNTDDIYKLIHDQEYQKKNQEYRMKLIDDYFYNRKGVE